MFVVIGGIGAIGSYLLESFFQAGVSLTLIENEADKVAELKQEYDVLVVQGSMMSHFVLREAEVAGCDLFIACSRIDAENIVACQLAKRLGARQCVARIYSEDIFPYEAGELEALFNVDWLFSPNRLTGYQLTHSLFSSQQLQFDNYFSSHLDVARLVITADSPLLKKKASRLSSAGKIALVGIYSKRAGYLVGEEVNRLSYLLEEGDVVLLSGIKQRLLRATPNLIPKEKGQSSRMYLAGIGKTGRSILSLISYHKKHITVLEKQLSLCRMVEERYGVEVLNVDASHYKELEEMHINPNASFVCGSESDAENLTYALTAKELGLKKIFPLVYNQDYKRILVKLGFNTSLSPSELGAKEIFRYFNQMLDLDFELVAGCPARAITKEIAPASSLIGAAYVALTSQEKKLLPLEKTELETITAIAVWRQGKIFLPPAAETVQEKDKILISCLMGNNASLRTLLKHK